MVKVAIIIVNWNKKNEVLALLSDIFAMDYETFDVILVDNASDDDSVPAIRQQFENISILQNDTNLGGTGGFNSGMSYALLRNTYRYLWLLDNDVRIKPDSLQSLVDHMETHPEVGIAGSKIIDPSCRDIVVELGGFVLKNKIGVRANFRNSIEKNIPNYPCKVDYVAVCSALVRSEALLKVGLMDSRFFLFWDDMDWGLSFWEKGYQVKAIPNSKVFHPAFTEKDRGDLINFYYDIRNSLLTYTKHTTALHRAFVFIKYIFLICLRGCFFLCDGEHFKAKLVFKGMSDFSLNRWGRYEGPLNNLKKLNKEKNSDFDEKRILLFAGSQAETIKAREAIGKYDFVSETTLLIRDDRINYFESSFDSFLSISSSNAGSFVYQLYLFTKIFFSKYGCALHLQSSDFKHLSYACKTNYELKDGKIIVKKANRKNIYKVVIATLTGFFVFPIACLIVFIASFMPSKKDL